MTGSPLSELVNYRAARAFETFAEAKLMAETGHAFSRLILEKGKAIA